MTTVTIAYGPNDKYHVQFKLDEDGETVLGRYLADEVIAHDGPWEARESVPGTSHIISVIRHLLKAYAPAGGHVTK